MARIKGIVMENKNGQAIILTPQGEFERTRIKKPIEVGEIYYGKPPSIRNYALMALIVLSLTLGTLDFFSVKAYAQVSSSLELGINRWNRVVTARALDVKGEAMLQQSNFTGQKVDEAVEVIVDKAMADGSLKQEIPDQNFPLSAQSKDNRDEKFKQNVEQDMNKGMQKALEKRNNKANTNKGAIKEPNKGSNIQKNDNEGPPTEMEKAPDKSSVHPGLDSSKGKKNTGK